MGVKILGGGGSGGGGSGLIPAVVAATAPAPANANYTSPGYTNNVGAARAINTLFAAFYLSRRAGALNRAAIVQTVAGGAGALARVGLYSDLAVHYPGALLYDSGSIAMDGANGLKIGAAINLALGLGQALWLVYLCGVAAAPTIQVLTNMGRGAGVYGIQDDLSAEEDSLSLAFAFAALPNPFPAGAGTTQNPPAVLLRYGS